MKSARVNILLSIAGIVLAFALIEAGLGLGAVYISWKRSHRAAADSRSLKREELRILCLGESTTEGGGWDDPTNWPSQLQSILGSARPDLRIRVFNRGVAGIRSDGIVSRLAGWLDEVKPDLVVAMIGINDYGNLLAPGPAGRMPLIPDLRSLRLFRSLWKNAFPEPLGPETHLWCADGDPGCRLHPLIQQRQAALRELRFNDLLALVARTVEEPWVPLLIHDQLALFLAYVTGGDMDLVSSFVESEIGRGIREVGESELDALIESTLEHRAEDFWPYYFASTVYERAGRAEDTRRILERGLAVTTVAGYCALRLASVLDVRGDTAGERKALAEAEQFLPVDPAHSMLLGAYMFHRKRYPEAIRYYERAIAEAGPSLATHQLAVLYHLVGGSEKARLNFESSSADDELRFMSFTRRNYQRIADALAQRGVRLVAMQYPTLDVGIIRAMLRGREVVYIDNEDVFKRAMKLHGYDALFYDFFAGTFGHATDLGDRILAENAARTMLQLLPAPEREIGGRPTDRSGDSVQ